MITNNDLAAQLSNASDEDKKKLYSQILIARASKANDTELSNILQNASQLDLDDISGQIKAAFYKQNYPNGVPMDGIVGYSEMYGAVTLWCSFKGSMDDEAFATDIFGTRYGNIMEYTFELEFTDGNPVPRAQAKAKFEPILEKIAAQYGVVMEWDNSDFIKCVLEEEDIYELKMPGK